MKIVTFVLAILAFLFGVGCIVFGIKFYFDNKKFSDNAVNVEGIVTNIKYKIGKNSTKIFAPEVEFKAVDGNQYTFVAETFSVESKNIYKVGQKIEVLYEDNNPQNAKINSFKELWFLAIWLLAIGLSCIVFGSYLFWTNLSK